MRKHVSLVLCLWPCFSHMDAAASTADVAKKLGSTTCFGRTLVIDKQVKPLLQLDANLLDAMVQAGKADPCLTTRRVVFAELMRRGIKTPDVIAMYERAALVNLDQNASFFKKRFDANEQATRDYSEELDLQESAIKALGAAQDPRALQALTHVLELTHQISDPYDDRIYRVYISLPYALTMYKTKALDALLSGYFKTWERFRTKQGPAFYDDLYKAMQAIGEEGRAFFENKAQSGTPEEKSFATDFLARNLKASSSPSSLSLLVKNLREGKLEDPEAALSELGHATDPDGRFSEVLFNIVVGSKTYQRYTYTALYSLYQLTRQPFTIKKPAPSTIKYWRAALVSEENGPFIAALLITPHLGRMRNEALPALLANVRSDTYERKIAATGTLAVFTKEQIAPAYDALVTNLNDSRQDLRQAAHTTLIKYWPKEEIEKRRARQSIDDLIKARGWTTLNDKDLIHSLLVAAIKLKPSDSTPWGCDDAACKHSSRCARSVSVLLAPRTDAKGNRLALVNFDSDAQSAGDGVDACIWLGASHSNGGQGSELYLFTVSNTVWKQNAVVYVVLPATDSVSTSYFFDDWGKEGIVVGESHNNGDFAGEDETPSTRITYYRWTGAKLQKLAARRKSTAR